MKKYILIIFLAVFVSSCGNGFLELYPKSDLSDEQAILSIADGRVAMNGVYAGLRTSAFFGRELFVIADAGCEDVVLRTDNSSRYVSNYRWQLQAGTMESAWVYGYKVVHRANELISRLTPLVPGVGETEGEKNQILGEAYFMRALVHYELVKLYGQAYNHTTDASHLGVPYMLAPNLKNDIPRETVKVCFDNIIADCGTALTLMNKNIHADPYSVGKYAINALLARAYLYMASTNNAEYFARAREYAEILINAPELSLVSANDYKITGAGTSLIPFYSPNMWGANYSSESIFTLPYLPVAGERNSTNAIGRIYLDKGKGYGDLLPSEQILELCGYYDNSSTDVRKTLFYEYGGKVSQRKFMGDGATDWDMSNINIFRLSEMYLIAAEGWAKGTGKDEGKALSYLNDLRTKRGLPILNNLVGGGLTSELLLERRRELCFEGHALIDHKRLNTSVIRIEDINNPENVKLGLTYPDNYFAFPIPQSELSINKLIEPNPGY